VTAGTAGLEGRGGGMRMTADADPTAPVTCGGGRSIEIADFIRVVAGLTCPFTASPKHSWAEVYVEPYGWISLDPTFAPNASPAAIDDRFFNRRPLCLRFTDARSDRVLHKNYFYCYGFRDREIARRVRVVETIEFIKPRRLMYSSRDHDKMAKKAQKRIDASFKKGKSDVSSGSRDGH